LSVKRFNFGPVDTPNLLYIVWNFEPSVVPSWGMPRWYGLMWALGFYLGYRILNRIYKSEQVPENWLDKTFLYVLLGAIVGARLGHCLFYDPYNFFIENPAELLYIWEGGLASHGGALGIIIATAILSRRVTHKPVLWHLDRIVIPTAIAGALIRLGNLFNHEIVGMETTSSLGFKFLRNEIGDNTAMRITGTDNAHDAFGEIANNPAYANVLAEIPARYPAQLFEAICCVFIFAFLMWLYWKTNAGRLTGFLMGAFCVMIFGTRFLIEYIKVDQGGIDDGRFSILNMGQILSIPLVLFGLYLVFRKWKELKKGYPSVE